jgi:hypothetical protein
LTFSHDQIRRPVLIIAVLKRLKPPRTAPARSSREH